MTKVVSQINTQQGHYRERPVGGILINIPHENNMKILNKVLANRTKQYMKR